MRNLYIITIIALVLMIALFSIQWYRSNKNFIDLRNDLDNSIENFKSSGIEGPILVLPKMRKDSTYYITKSDIEEINKSISSLNDQVRSESSRTITIIDKDLDRLNFYMALGIGFMTLLGVFVPILVNVTSGQDLRSEQKDLRTKLDGLEHQKELINEIHQKFDTEQLRSINQELQNAVGRFYFIGPTLMSNRTRESYEGFNALVDDIKRALNEASEFEGHIVKNNDAFKTNLKDFKFFLSSHETQLQLILNTRQDIGILENIIAQVDILLNSNNETEKLAYENLLVSLDKLKETIQSKHQKILTAV